MHHSRISDTYREGVRNFIDFVRSKLGESCDIRCPCVECMNRYTLKQETVVSHLCLKGMMVTYDKWVHHGESISEQLEGQQSDCNDFSNNGNFEFDDGSNEDDFLTLLNEIRRAAHINDVQENEENGSRDREHTEFEKILQMLGKELYPDCKNFSVLSFVIKLLHLKVYNHWTNKSLDMLLGLMKDVLPDGANVPKSYYEAKTMLREIGLGYETIHACK